MVRIYVYSRTTWTVMSFYISNKIAIYDSSSPSFSTPSLMPFQTHTITFFISVPFRDRSASLRFSAMRFLMTFTPNFHFPPDTSRWKIVLCIQNIIMNLFFYSFLFNIGASQFLTGIVYTVLVLVNCVHA